MAIRSGIRPDLDWTSAPPTATDPSTHAYQHSTVRHMPVDQEEGQGRGRAAVHGQEQMDNSAFSALS
eukprot:2370095-Alexandrium_andersonii.AAC.1